MPRAVTLVGHPRRGRRRRDRRPRAARCRPGLATSPTPILGAPSASRAPRSSSPSTRSSPSRRRSPTSSCRPPRSARRSGTTTNLEGRVTDGRPARHPRRYGAGRLDDRRRARRPPRPRRPRRRADRRSTPITDAIAAGVAGYAGATAGRAATAAARACSPWRRRPAGVEALERFRRHRAQQLRLPARGLPHDVRPAPSARRTRRRSRRWPPGRAPSSTRPMPTRSAPRSAVPVRLVGARGTIGFPLVASTAASARHRAGAVQPRRFRRTADVDRRRRRRGHRRAHRGRMNGWSRSIRCSPAA